MPRTVHVNSQALAAIESVLHIPGRKGQNGYSLARIARVYTDRKQERFDNRSWFEVAVKEAQIPPDYLAWSASCLLLVDSNGRGDDPRDHGGRGTQDYESQAARYAHLSPQHTQSVVDRIVGTR